MNFSEPSTMITDYFIFIQSLYFFIKLLPVIKKSKQISQTVWTFALLTIGLASFFGGTHHGFEFIISKEANQIFWKLTTYTIGFVSFLIFYGTVKASVSKRFHKLFFAISFFQLLFYFYWMIDHDSFKYVIFDYVPSMIMVFSFQLFSHFKIKSGSERFMMAGVIVSFIGAGIQQSGYDLHQHLNHNDIYHFIQMYGNFLFYKGILKLKDQK